MRHCLAGGMRPPAGKGHPHAEAVRERAVKTPSVGKSLLPGESVEVPHPFIRGTYCVRDEEGCEECIGWRPGVRNADVYPDDSEMVADGMGVQILTVVAKFRPGKFPERIFYTRKWRDPDGTVFGKSNLHTRTTGAFTRLVSGYRHAYRVERKEPGSLTHRTA